MPVSFEHQLDVRWRDTDALGHVNHAVFLTYLEVARDAFFDEVLGSGPLYVLARIEIDFLAEIPQADRLVRARIAVERLGRTSLTTLETIRRETGEIAAEARVVTVRWDGERRVPTPFSDTERARLTAVLAADS